MLQGRDAQPVENSIERDVAGRGLVRQWQAFVSAISDGTTPAVSAEDGLLVVACIEAAFRASRERREVAVGWASVENVRRRLEPLANPPLSGVDYSRVDLSFDVSAPIEFLPDSRAQ